MGEILGFLFELGKERSTSLRGYGRSRLAEETTHVGLQQRLCLVFREDCGLLLNITLKQKRENKLFLKSVQPNKIKKNIKLDTTEI